MAPHILTTAGDTKTALATARAGPGPFAAQEASDAVTKEVYASLSNALNGLVVRYAALQKQTLQAGNQSEATPDVEELRQQIRDQDTRHKENMDEIQNIIDQILQNEADDMRKQIHKELSDQIDQLVKEQVAECLKEHLPEELRLDLAMDKREYEDLQLALHNSESRRLNGMLRANKADGVLHTVYMSDGSVSPRFPKDLRTLFDLDADTVRALMKDYGINGVGDTRDTNLNKFMQFCGVRYQLVKSDNRKNNNTTRAV